MTLPPALEVAALYPPQLPAHLLPTSAGGRPVHVALAPYADDFTARNAKAGGADADLVREIEMTLSAETRSALADAEVVIALDVPLDLPTLAPNLRWVQAFGAGVGQLVRATEGTPIVVSTAAGAGAPAIAEFVLARLLQVTRRLRELDRKSGRAHLGRRCPG